MHLKGRSIRLKIFIIRLLRRQDQKGLNQFLFWIPVFSPLSVFQRLPLLTWLIFIFRTMLCWIQIYLIQISACQLYHLWGKTTLQLKLLSLISTFEYLNFHSSLNIFKSVNQFGRWLHLKEFKTGEKPKQEAFPNNFSKLWVLQIK